MTSATEELRSLLDERGVEWWPMHDIESGYREDRDTEFLVYGCKHVAHEWGCRLQVDMLTPKQAVAATLGPRTCEDMSGGDPCVFACSYCGAMFDHPEHERVYYCPNCGAKVVE